MGKSAILVIAVLCFGIIVSGCGREDDEGRASKLKGESGRKTIQERENGMELTSAVFKDEGSIPAKYTCDGDNISPPLEIEGIPEDTASLALVVDDPDAPGSTFDHWVVWNIPASTQKIAEGEQPNGVKGKNDFGDLMYGGPCPPSGTHSYRFKIYALDTKLDLEEGSTKNELENAMDGAIIAKDVLVGNYSRQ